MGQKSDAVFAGMHFIKYFDATQNETFLKERAYPFLREVVDFCKTAMLSRFAALSVSLSRKVSLLQTSRT